MYGANPRLSSGQKSVLILMWCLFGQFQDEFVIEQWFLNLTTSRS